MIRPGERLLLDPVIGGVKWQVIESDPTIEEELVDNQGLCKPDRHTIYINRNEVPSDSFEYVLVHELAHATIFMIGGKEGLRCAAGVSRGATRFEALEEYIVCGLFHGVWDTLKRNGWINIPVRDQ